MNLKLKEKALASTTRDLEELNAALRVLLKKIEEEKKELGEKVTTNVKQLISPYLEKLREGRTNERQQKYLEFI